MLLGLLTCKEALERLDDYVDRELGEEESKHVRRHLRVCHACARKFAFEENLVRNVREKLGRIEAPPDLLKDVMSALTHEP